ncbi:MAG: AMIN domain-containing protein [Oscillatoriaceae cyanobacterium]
MKHYGELGSILGMGAVAVMAVQPVLAATTQVTGVKVNPSGSGVEVILETARGDRPQVFSVNRGNDVVSDIINTQLTLPGGGSFRQNNPAPGIASVVVTPLDTNSIRVIVSGASSAPFSQIIPQDDRGIVMSYNTTGAPAPQAQLPTPTTPPSTPPTQTSTRPNQPDVLVPNPEISIDGLPVAQGSGAAPPPFLPRAVAPPVGDIAISNVDSSPSFIALDNNDRISRLVLRDAPVRDVLALLARATGLNLAYGGGSAPTGPGDQAAPDAAGATDSADSLKITLDIENEAVQDVFNYILRLSNLEANRVGSTIFVGTRLPEAARDIITRTFRLNQVPVASASGFLSAQGAETQRVVEQVQIQTIGQGATARTVETRQIQIVPLAATTGSGPLLLRGLSVLTDDRLNALTLVGEPRKVEIATRFLMQLDARRRQVAVNVKIIDVNLNNQDTFNSSFSFGINDSFFVNDGGTAVANFGGFNPPTANTTAGGVIVPSVITNPVTGEPFYDRSNPQYTIPVPGIPSTASPTQSAFLRPIPPFGEGGRSDPFTPGISDYNYTVDDTGITGDVTFSLPTLFQYPSRFLATLQAQVISRNAKILTDPTLVIQEGQTANVSLTEEIVGNVETKTDFANGLAQTTVTAQIKEAGLQLEIAVDRIDDNGFISLAINPVVSAPVGTQRLGDNEITLLSLRQLSSGQIRLRDGQTLILSGIIQEQDRTTVRKIPLLGDLPLIGSLFRNNNTENQRAEVIVLVTPQILDDSDSSGYGYAPGPDARQMMSRPGAFGSGTTVSPQR